MKHTIFNKVRVAMFAILVTTLTLHTIHAALVPSLTITAINNNTQIQIIIFGADPNAPVMLYYPSSSSMIAVNIGQTNSIGYFSTTVSPTTYSITSGVPTYVIIDGAQSQTIQWPSYSLPSTTSGYISLSSQVVSVPVGQSTTIGVTSNVNNMGTLSVTSNTNPSIGSISVSGNQIIINGISAGSGIVTVCASSAGCASLQINVSQSATQTVTQQQSSPTSITLSQTTVNLQVGQSSTISMTGPGSFYVSRNANLSVVSTNVNGSSLTLNGVAAGTSVVSVCSAGNNIMSCGSVNVTVTGSASSNTISPNTSSSSLSFSRSNISLSLGDRTTITILAPPGLTGVYSLNSNSNPDSVSANVDGSTVAITGIAFGGSTIKICEITNVCGSFYVYVGPGNPGVTIDNVRASTQPPIISSISITSNNVGNSFLGAGVALTITFSASQPLVNPTVTIAGHQLSANGSGSGPYTSIYTMNGAESMPMPISISFTNTAGLTGRVAMSLGSAPVAQVTNSPTTQVAAAVNSFTSLLSSGSVGAEVRLLQQKLKDLGLYVGPITGKFGILTEAALKKFQSKHGLSPVGVVGPSTRAILNK